MGEMSREKIDKIKRERSAKARLMKDRSVYIISLMTLPTLMVLIGAMIISAVKLEDSQLAVISGLISSVSIGLITLLQRTVGGAEKEDPMVVIAKALVEHLTNGKDGSQEIIMDKNSIRISGGDSKIVTSSTKDLVYGEDEIKKNK